MGKMECEFSVTLRKGQADRQRKKVEISGSVCAERVNINLCCKMEMQDGKWKFSVSPHTELSFLCDIKPYLSEL